ncbi:MAG: antirestriction protein ArdA [Varibaculum cambriense]|nr:antirestriction protein ArdA [Varibaculum cambriense]
MGNNNDFENKHPRGKGGKFTKKYRAESGLTLGLDDSPSDLDTPKVFVDCVDCRRKGITTGKWVNLTGTEGLMPVDVCLDREHENLEVSDTDGELYIAPKTVEEASGWGKAYSTAKEDGNEKAFCAWINERGITDPSEALEFETRYQGEYDSWEDFASEYAYQSEGFDVLNRYFDYDSFSRDLKLNCEVEETSDGVIIRNFDDDPDGKVAVKADSFEDYARSVANETVIEAEDYNWLDAYCDYGKLGEDLKNDYSSAESENGVYIFRAYETLAYELKNDYTSAESDNGLYIFRDS